MGQSLLVGIHEESDPGILAYIETRALPPQVTTLAQYSQSGCLHPSFPPAQARPYQPGLWR